MRMLAHAVLALVLLAAFPLAVGAEEATKGSAYTLGMEGMT